MDYRQRPIGPLIMPAKLIVLYEDNHCLAVAKLAGWLTMGDATGDPSMHAVAKEYIKRKYAKPGDVFLGLVHRLDRPVSGALLFARTSKAAARLSTQFRQGTVEKVYWAVVSGQRIPPQGELHHVLRKDRERNLAVVDPRGLGQPCMLYYQQRARSGNLVWLEVRPRTGRSHQIRAQLAASGWPIVGDRKYGSQQTFAPGAIALHARALTFQHPVRQERVTVECPLPFMWLVFQSTFKGVEEFCAPSFPRAD